MAKALVQKIAILALSIYVFIYLAFSILPPRRTANWLESLPLEFIKIFILILLVYISPQKREKLANDLNFKADFKKVIVTASVWLLPILLVLFTARNLSFFNLFMGIFSLGLLFFVAFKLNHNILLKLFLLAFVLDFFLVLVIFTDLLFLLICLTLLIASLWIFAYAKATAKTKTILSLAIFGCQFYLYYNLNYALPVFTIIFFISSVPFLIYISRVNKLSSSDKALDILAFVCNLVAFLGVLSGINFMIFSPPSRVQASMVKLQKGGFILIEPKDMSYGIRLAYPEGKDRWLALIHSFKLKSQSKVERNKGLLLTMLDKKGDIIKPPISIGRIDYIARLKNEPNLIFTLGLGGYWACLFDIEDWKVLVCSNSEWKSGHIAISQDDKFVALYNDALKTSPKLYKLLEIEGEKALVALDDSELKKEKCCSGNMMKFFGDKLVMHDSKARLESSTESEIFRTYYQTFYIIEFLGDKPKIAYKIKDYNSYKLTYNFAHPPDEKEVIYVPIFFSPSSFGGGVEIVNLKKRKVEKVVKSPLMLGLRVLVYVPELDVFCGASELGLVFVIDRDLRIKKVLYGGAHIRDIYVKGSEIIFASQAGIVKFDLKAVRL